MKVLLDTCVSPLAAHVLRTAGHDAATTLDWPKDPGDDEILAFAAREGRVLVTLDKDFGALAVLRGQRHCGIIRLVGFRAADQGATCVSIMLRYASDLGKAAIITVEPGRVRIRPGISQ